MTVIPAVKARPLLERIKAGKTIFKRGVQPVKLPFIGQAQPGLKLSN